MQMNRLSLLLTTLILLCCPDSSAWTTNLYLENDLFGETDQHYTNGIRASWISPNLDEFENDPALPSWLEEVNEQLSFFHDSNKGLHRNVVVSVGQLIFTPTDVDATELLENDRPYAGFLYMGFAYHTRSDNQLDTVEATLGIVGPASLAEEAQDLIHEIRGFKKFKGWDNQLRNELGLNLLYEHKQKLTLPNLTQGIQQDFIGHAGASLGNVYTYINTGGEYRLGWQLPDDFGTASLRPGGDSSAAGPMDRRRRQTGITSIHGFVSVDGRLVARDIFLDGNTFRSSHSVTKRHLVADLSIGLSIMFNRWKISYAKVFRSREFEHQRDSHKYGSLSFSYTW